jgi:AraC family transcriptional regulator of adaptative response / DNA-3-methyladenine glycosylase II
VQAVFLDKAPLLALSFSASLLPHSAALLAAVRRWLDLDAQPSVIDAALQALPGDPGLRLPGSLDAFELAVRAVLGQQVTVAAARTLARRLVDRFGSPLATPWAAVHRCFPSPQDIAKQPVDGIASLGIIRSRATAIVALAQAWPTLQAAMLPGAEPEPLIAQLCALPGIGPWTAHYVSMRALGWPDAFPPGDVAVLKALRGLPGAATADESSLGKSALLTLAKTSAEACSQAWRPWRSYAVLRLWNSLDTPVA